MPYTPHVKRFALPLLIIAAVAAVGCKGGSLAGNYKGDQGILALKEDKSFTLTNEKAPQGAAAGKWEMQGEKLHLKLETIGGKPVDEFLKQMEKLAASFGKKPDAAQMKKAEDQMKDMEVAVSEDKKTLTIGMPGQGQQATFTKQG